MPASLRFVEAEIAVIVISAGNVTEYARAQRVDHGGLAARTRGHRCAQLAGA